MKKKLFLFIFLSLVCVVTINIKLNSNISYAQNLQNEVTFEISNSSSKIRVQNNDLSVDSQVNSWSDVLQIASCNSTVEDSINFHFNNFNTNSSLTFNGLTNIALTGTISSNLTDSTIILDSNQNLMLKNLAINAENSVNIVLFNGINNELTIAENVTYSNQNNDEEKYLVEYAQNNVIKVTNINSNVKLLVSDFEFENDVVIQCESGYKNFVKLYFVENENYYNTFNYVNSKKGFAVTSYVKFNFNLNKGVYENLTPEYNFDYSTNIYEIVYAYGTYNSGLIDFDSQGTPKRSHAVYDGLYGVAEYQGQTYYFDLDMLKNYVENGEIFSTIPTYFVTSLKELDNNYSVKYYSSLVKTSIEYYKHFDFFKQNNLAPTYIAKWIVEEYDIDFVTDNDQTLSSITLEYGQTIPTFETLIKTGYDFAGWYTNSSRTKEFTSLYMPANNLTLYAKWVEADFELSFETNGGTEISAQTYKFGEQTQRPADPKKEGHNFENWYLDEALTEIFEFGQMPSNDVKLYANWTLKKYNIFVFSNASNKTKVISGIEYNSVIPNLNSNIEIGYTFDGYYTDNTYSTEFDLTMLVKGDINIYAKFTAILYEINFNLNYETENELTAVKSYYGYSVLIPEVSRSGYIFDGWYYDNSFEQKCQITLMPAENLLLFAKWIPKTEIKLNLEPQTYYLTDGLITFRNETGYSNLKFYYLVDGEWTTDAPSGVGSYDVRVVRAEDENYLAVDTIIQNGFNIIQRETNITWLIVLLYIATIAEILVSLVVRVLLKKKLSATYVLIGGIAVSSSQFVHLVISGLMCLAGFVYMIYQLVLLTRSLNNENFAPSKEDNRQRFKDDLRFQTDSKNKELDFEIKVKTDESFGDKYSEQDIEKLLNNDDYTQKIKESRGKFAEISYETEDASNGKNYQNNDNDLDSNEIINQEDDVSSGDSDENIMPQLHYDIEEKREFEENIDSDVIKDEEGE